jgi:hypothetical protein
MWWRRFYRAPSPFAPSLRRENDLSGIRTRRSTANILITLALDDESRETLLAGPQQALEVELATHCREGTWSCEVDLAGC